MRSMGAAAVFDIAAAVPPIMKSIKKAVASVGFVLVILTEVLLKTNKTGIYRSGSGWNEDTESTTYELQEGTVTYTNVVFRILPSWLLMCLLIHSRIQRY